jgi:hypothetical protein
MVISAMWLSAAARADTNYGLGDTGLAGFANAGYPVLGSEGYGFGVGYCTWFVAAVVPGSQYPYYPSGGGNACDWYGKAQSRGLPTGTQPQVGAIMCMDSGTPGSGGDGHVGLVLGINGTTLTLGDANWVKSLCVGIHTLSSSDSHIQGYIYGDSTPPSIDWSGSRSGYWYNDPNVQVVKWSLSDTSGVQGFYQWWDTNPNTDGDCGSFYNSSTGDMVLNYIWSSPDGVYYTHVDAYDNSLRHNNRQYVSGWCGLDRTPPTVALTSGPTQGVWYNAPQTINWKASDNLSGVRGYGQAWDADAGFQSASASGSTIMQEGVHTLNVHVWDNTDNARGDAGNNQDCTFGPYMLDTVAPGVQVTGPTTGTWYNTQQTVGWVATDGTSGVGTTNLQWDSNPSFTVAASGTAQIPEGIHTVGVSATDNAGNVGTGSGGAYWIDLTAPTTTISLSPSLPDGANGWYVTQPVVTLSASDAVPGIQTSGVAVTNYSIKSAGLQPYSRPFTLTGNGPQQISYFSADVAGNVEATHSLALNMDTTPPYFSEVTVPQNSGSLGTLAASWLCDDAESGIAEYDYAIGTTCGSADVKARATTGTVPCAYAPNLVLTEGQEYYFTVWASNSAGLWSKMFGFPICATESDLQDFAPSMNSGGVSTGLDPDGVRRSANYSLTDSLGGFVVGEMSDGSHTLQSGYLHDASVVSGKITLLYYIPTSAGIPGAVELQDSTGKILETHSITLDSSGGYSFTTNLTGSYTACAKCWHWLAKAMPVTISGGSSTVNFTLKNGDVNGDNFVEDQDYSIMGEAWYSIVGDPNYNASADLNGDGAVEDQDYSIMGLFWYQSGDPF